MEPFTPAIDLTQVRQDLLTLLKSYMLGAHQWGYVASLVDREITAIADATQHMSDLDYLYADFLHACRDRLHKWIPDPQWFAYALSGHPDLPASLRPLVHRSPWDAIQAVRAFACDVISYPYDDGDAFTVTELVLRETLNYQKVLAAAVDAIRGLGETVEEAERLQQRFVDFMASHHQALPATLP